MAKNKPIIIKATVSRVKSLLLAVKGLRIALPNEEFVGIGSRKMVKPRAYIMNNVMHSEMFSF